MAIASMPSSSRSSSAEAFLEEGVSPWFSDHAPLGYVGGDTNLYRYVSNSPTDETDPSGMAPPPPPGTKQQAPVAVATPTPKPKRQEPWYEHVMDFIGLGMPRSNWATPPRTADPCPINEFGSHFVDTVAGGGVVHTGEAAAAIVGITQVRAALMMAQNADKDPAVSKAEKQRLWDEYERLKQEYNRCSHE